MALLVPAPPKSNYNAILAQRMSCTKTRVVPGAHINLSVQDPEGASRGKARIRALLSMVQCYYYQANVVVAREIKNLGENLPGHAWIGCRDTRKTRTLAL